MTRLRIVDWRQAEPMSGSIIQTLPPGSITSIIPPLCNGPVGLPIVLPVIYSPYLDLARITVYDPSTISSQATSMCDGSTMYNLWHCNHQSIIQSTATAHPSFASWVYVMATEGTPATLQAMLFTPPRPCPRVLPRVIRAGRRAVRRSIDIYARFRGMDEIRRFVRGEEIVYDGHLFRYRVHKTMKVVDHTMNPVGGHAPYSLRLVDKQTDKNLANGCVYIPGVPLIDQLLALSFHVQDEKDEREFLRQTNWTPRLPAMSRRLLEAA